MHYVRMSCHFYEEVRDVSQLKMDNFDNGRVEEPKGIKAGPTVNLEPVPLTEVTKADNE